MKFENISDISLIILVGISDYWDSLFSFSSLISLSISLKLTYLKLKAPFLLHLVLIGRILRCFSYLRIAFKVGSLTFTIIGSKSEYWKMLRLFTILQKKLLKTSAVSFPVFTISPFHINLSVFWHWIFRKVKALLFSKKVCYRKLFFHLSFHSKLFLTKRRNNFFVWHTSSYFLHFNFF